MEENKYQTQITINKLRDERDRIRKEMDRKLSKLKDSESLKWLRTHSYYKGQLDYIKELITYLN